VSRIDEALRRSRGRGAAPTNASAQADVFVSAWDEQANPEPRSNDATERNAGNDAGHLLRTAEARGVKLSNKWKERLASSAECAPELLEQFRRLAGTLHNAQAASGIRRLLVSSASPGEGKTLTAINLALVLSESYRRRVLLIDADLRRPSINEVVDVTGSVGLSAALKADGDQKLAVIPLTPTLTLLPAGPADPDPLSGLTSPRMRRILDEASTRFDWVIVDGPPIGPLADASQLAQVTDGTLLVVRAARTPHAAVEKAVAAIGRQHILGIVLNGISGMELDPYHPYYRPDKPANGAA
jgi:receptor protein-tyrosine kinase